MELPTSFCILTQFLLLQFFLYAHPAAPLRYSNFTDLSSLLAFKAGVADPQGVLAANWTAGTSFCHWVGVYCSSRRQRVTALKLRQHSLRGTISPHLGNLSFLSHLDLGNNSLTGAIPGSLGRLSRLGFLNLAMNSLSGPVPPSIFNMSSLVSIYLVYNSLNGSIPSPVVLPKLELASISANGFTGEIPPSFARCSRLRVMSVSHTELSGSIPAELGNLTELTLLYLGANQLTGSIPASIGNLTKLTELEIGRNHLGGEIPKELGNLRNLGSLKMDDNALSGPIPNELTNASMLHLLGLVTNDLTGPVPPALGKSMPLLDSVYLGGNRLAGGLEFVSSLSNCRNLTFLDVWGNELDGVLPESVGNLSENFAHLNLQKNRITGSLPRGLGNLSGLIALELQSNELTGAIPASLARLHRLQVIYLDGNRLRGTIPDEIGRMAGLSRLYLQGNALSGKIPGSLSNFSMLQHLSLAANELSSTIPLGLWGLTGLIELDLSNNALSGSVPAQVGNLKTLNWLDLSKNRLSGNMTSALGTAQMLEHVDLSRNGFRGRIPESFGELVSVAYLNLSRNLLSDAIPVSLAGLRYLGSLDLSFNRLEGQVPDGRVFSNASVPVLVGNAALCGAPRLGLPPCPAKATAPSSRTRLGFLKYLLSAVAAAVVLACLCLLVTLHRRRRKTADETSTPYSKNHRRISYHELVRATDNFSHANLLGRGSFSSVFRACLDDGLVAAAKVLNLEVEGASRSFDAECRALSSVRHRNLVRVISACSNLDFKALVLDYMPNGSLDEWLHSDDRYLSLLKRMDVMTDVSLALEHLHHHHPQVVVHCDLKPSNVLLDADMVARVSDFGLAKLLLGDSRAVGSASMPGTIGYMAPEYGSTGNVSRSGDIYSFGITLLETFTGRRPTDAMFTGESSLRRWVSNACPARVGEIADCHLRANGTAAREQKEKMGSAAHRCLCSVIELGLACSDDLPRKRVPMRDVVARLRNIKVEYLSSLELSSSSANHESLEERI